MLESLIEKYELLRFQQSAQISNNLRKFQQNLSSIHLYVYKCSDADLYKDFVPNNLCKRLKTSQFNTTQQEIQDEYRTQLFYGSSGITQIYPMFTEVLALCNKKQMATQDQQIKQIKSKKSEGEEQKKEEDDDTNSEEKMEVERKHKNQLNKSSQQQTKNLNMESQYQQVDENLQILNGKQFSQKQEKRLISTKRRLLYQLYERII
ncbi:hypothetical protein ABPG72_002230 [Tetrahymena utriculariae]